MDFVPKLSSVACVLQCGGLWFGGKGWGLTWKINQIVVKPREVISVYGKCHITLSQDEMKEINESPAGESGDSDRPVVATTNIEVADSDDDAEDEPESPADTEVDPEPVKIKKTVKKPEPATDPENTPAPKKKVVKKKVIA